MNSKSILAVAISMVAFCGNLVAGLAVGRDYQRPSVPMTPQFGDSELGSWKEATPADVIARGDWWSVFSDPVLDNLERRAAGNNQDLKAAIARVTQARAVARNVKADFFPSLTFDGSASRSRFSGNTLNTPIDQMGNNFRVPFDLTYELDLWDVCAVHSRVLTPMLKPNWRCSKILCFC